MCSFLWSKNNFFFLQITELNLSDNNLTAIPASLVELPKLETLNLSHNKMTSFPDIKQWSSSLAALDLSDNQLSSLPINVTAPALISLNLSKNSFGHIPLCICLFSTLKNLDLSDNPNIRALPFEMGMLTKLEDLKLDGLKKLKEPPKKFIQSNPQVCISYLSNRLSSYADGKSCMQLMIVGSADRGKHTLFSALPGENTVHIYQTVSVAEWDYRPSLIRRSFQFRMWIFNSKEDYNATHQCFLSQRSLYLLVFDIKDGTEGVHKLKPWLDIIAHRAPYSGVIIVCALDEMPQLQERNNVGFLLQQAKVLIADQKRLETVEVLPVCFKSYPEDVFLLKDTIYNYAVNFPTLQKGTK